MLVALFTIKSTSVVASRDKKYLEKSASKVGGALSNLEDETSQKTLVLPRRYTIYCRILVRTSLGKVILLNFESSLAG